MLDIRHKITRFEKVNLKVLKQENKKLKDRKIITFDIETWGLNPSNLALASFYNGEEFFNYLTKEEIINFLDNLKEDCIIYAHNGSKYDIAIFFEELMFSEKWFMRKHGDILSFKYTNKNDKEIVFKDSYHILNDSLKNLAKSFLKQEEQKLEISDKFINPQNHGFQKEVYLENIEKYNRENINDLDIEYCNRDTQVLYNILHNETLKNYGFDFKNYNTIASIAYKKLIDNSKRIVIDNNKDKEFLSLYFGGLTEVFTHTNTLKEIVCLDYNSSYPFQMTKEFGNPLYLERYYYEELEENTLKEELIEYWKMLNHYPNGYSEVSIKVKSRLGKKEKELLKKIPLFPLKGMNYFDYSNGEEYLVTLMNIELKNLVRFFDIKPIYSMYSKEMFTPFKDYIESIYKERQVAKKEKDTSKSLILKLLMNSAYGRLGLKTNQELIQIGSFEYIKKEILDNLYRSIQEIENEGYTYIYELASERLERINTLEKECELLENEELEEKRIELLKYIKAFIIELNQDIDTLKIKTINKIPNHLLEEEEKDKDIYVLSYTSDRKAHIESSYYLASEITSKARAQLIEDIIDIELSELGEICYCDTDSLHIETNTKKELLEHLNDKINPTKLGYLSSDGEFDKGYWLSKKHYYLFKEEDKKLVFKKGALKGFTPFKTLDYFVHSSPTIFVNKIYSRISNINTNTNTLIENKTFLNFVTKRDLNNKLLKIQDSGNKLERIYHSLEIQKLYFKMCESGLYYEENNEIIELTKERIDNRIKELEEEFKTKVAANVFMFDVVNFHFTTQSANRKLKAILSKEQKPKKPKKKGKKEQGLKGLLEKKTLKMKKAS